MGTTSEWGQTVLNNVDKPSVPGTIDGKPWQERAAEIRDGAHQITDEEVAAQQQGGAVAAPPQQPASVYDEEPTPPQSVFGDPWVQKLHARRAEDAKDTALIEIMLTDDPSDFDQRVDQNVKKNGSFDTKTTGEWIFDEIHKLSKEIDFHTEVKLLENLDGYATNEQKVDYLVEWTGLVDKKLLTDRMIAALYVARAKGFDVPMAGTEAFALDMGAATLGALRDELHAQDVRDLKIIRSDIVISNSYESNHPENMAFADVFFQEVIPMANVWSKGLLINKMEEIMGMESNTFRPDLAFQAEEIREELARMQPVDRVAVMTELHTELQRMAEEDVILNKIFRRYNTIEQVERIFTNDLLEKNITVDGLDRILGTLEVVAEAVASAFMIKAATKGTNVIGGMRGLLSSPKSIAMRKASEVARNRKLQAGLDNSFQGRHAEELGLPQGPAAASQMPKPQTLVDERQVGLPGVADELDRQEVLIGEITKAQVGRLSKVFTNVEKQQIAEREIAALNLGDHARVVPKMSVIDDTGDGVLINAVITRDGESAYKGFQDLLSDVLILDPRLEKLTIIRRGSDGNLHHVVMTADELARLATNNVENLTEVALFKKLKEADPNSLEFLQLEREATRRIGQPSVSAVLDDEYFLQYNHMRTYHPTDKVAFGADTIKHTVAPLGLLSPNAKFGDDLAGAAIGAAPVEARLVRLYNDLQQPFYDLNSKSKQRVAQIFEWAEDEAALIGGDPDLYRVLGQFPDLTPKEIKGWMAVRRSMDAQFDALDRRLYLEMDGRGHKTAQALDPELPTYHGKVLDQAEGRSGTYYDPVTKEQVKLGDKEIAQLYDDGGSLMELDIAIDVPGSNGMFKSTKIMLNDDMYKVGTLSKTPLERYPGYRYRMYRDPYYVTKKTNGVSVDGAIRAGSDTTTEALRTSGSQLEAEAFLDRAFTRQTDSKGVTKWVDDDGNEYGFQRSKDLNQTDNALKQKEALYRENRMFWEHRNRPALQNTNSNTSEIMDFTLALERGTAMQIRQNTGEDMMRAFKEALLGDFNHLAPLKGFSAATHSVDEIIDALEKGMKGPDIALRDSYKKALSVAKYIRQLEGVDNSTIPFMREQIMRTAVWMDRLMGKTLGTKAGKLSAVERLAMEIDPFQRMKSIAFGVFMVMRPFKQLLLQASQPMFLAGIDPLYVLSGKGLTDTLALRAGFGKLRHANYVNDGYNGAGLAKAMGLTKREFKHLVKKLDESGTIDVVDVHSFNGGTRKWNQLQPHDGSATGRTLYGLKKTGSVAYNTLKSAGFDFGESINKLATFNVAWRRVVREKGYKSLLDLTDEDWAKVNLDTEHLSFAMTKPGAFGYQSGNWAVTTQFMSFTHKMALSLIGQNPALSTKETLKIWGGLSIMFGTNMFGARDATKQAMYNMGLDDSTLGQEIPGMGFTVIDLLSAGVIQNMFNRVGHMTAKDWEDLDTSTVGPIFNGTQFLEMMLEGLAERPLATAFGPFGNRASKFLQGLDTADQLWTGLPDAPIEDRLVYMFDQMAKDTIPQYNNSTLSYLWAKVGKMYTSSGNRSVLEPSWNAVIAKGVFGVGTMQETEIWHMRDMIADRDAVVKDMIFSGQRALKTHFAFWRNGDISQDAFNDRVRFVGELAKLAPEGRREEVIQGIMKSVGFSDDDPNATFALELAKATIGRTGLTPAEAKRFMSTIDVPDEIRASLESWIEESYDTRVLNDKEIQERTIRSNPNLRD
jgi:hypothetical protein